MFLLVGLGNPGEEYNHTPHNVGFEALDYIYHELEKTGACGHWKLDKKNKALITRYQGVNKVNKAIELMLIKPQTFMNLSGSALRLLVSQYPNIPISNILIIHDDIDLPQGTVRIRKNGSSAGHKGVQSIIDALGTEEFGRIRIGIRPAPEFSEDTTKFVLKKMNKEKQKLFQQVYQKVYENILEIIEKGVEEKTATIKQPTTSPPVS